MSGDESSSGRLAAYFTPESRKQAMWWALAAVSVPLAGAAVWWLSETTLDTLAPPEVGRCLYIVPAISRIHHKCGRQLPPEEVC